MSNLIASNVISVLVLVLLLTLHSSLQHEVLHGHPFKKQWLNELLVSVPFGLFIPFQRFRDTHLQHHIDETLTDPYDDPETNYLDPAVWNKCPRVCQFLLSTNNTLAGRLVLGPVIGLVHFYRSDLRKLLTGNRSVLVAYLLHMAGLIPLLLLIIASEAISIWLYLLSAYCALSVLKVRTFLEHQANEKVQGRTVIIEDRGILSWLFLNNNFHYVHHMFPKAPWYRLPSLYDTRQQAYINQNGGYVYRNYLQVFSLYFFSSKDPVAHPLWQSTAAQETSKSSQKA